MAYAYTLLMEANPLAGIFELVKNLFGAGIILYSGDWFGISAHYPWALPLIIVYFFVSTFITGILAWQQFQILSNRKIADF